MAFCCCIWLIVDRSDSDSDSAEWVGDCDYLYETTEVSARNGTVNRSSVTFTYLLYLLYPLTNIRTYEHTNILTYFSFSLCSLHCSLHQWMVEKHQVPLVIHWSLTHPLKRMRRELKALSHRPVVNGKWKITKIRFPVRPCRAEHGGSRGLKLPFVTVDRGRMLPELHVKS